MFVKLLGPLEATRNGAVITPTAKKPRQALALLAMSPGELVTQDSLVEELWGTDVPRSAKSTLQGYIMRLRRLIEAGGPTGARTGREVLVTQPLGYRLEIAPDHVDVHHYQEQVVAGHLAADLGDDEAAARLFGAALDQWRGPVLVDVPAGPLLGIEVTRLAQSRLGVVEARIDAELRRGRHHRLLGELAGLTARYPMHEKLCMQYMTALHLSGCGCVR